MEYLHGLLNQSALLPVFFAVAIGYSVGRITIGGFNLGGLAGTLLAAIFIGLLEVKTDEAIKSMAFALFIYTLGYVGGPQFFGSLGRKTLGQVHLAVFSTIVIFVVIFLAAKLFHLDPGTAAGLLAGATTESASIGTASDALKNLDVSEATRQQYQTNIAVTYAVTYLFGMTLVVFFTSRWAPKLMGMSDFKQSAKDLEKEHGASENLAPGEFEFIRDVVARVYRVQKDGGKGFTIESFEEKYQHKVTFQQIFRNNILCELTADFIVHKYDLITLVGQPSIVIEAGKSIGKEADPDKIEEALIGEICDVVVTNSQMINKTIATLRDEIDMSERRGAYAIKITRMERDIPLLGQTQIHLGDVVRLIGIPSGVKKLANLLGHTIEPNQGVDYVYLALGIITGYLIGQIPLPIAGLEIEMGLGGGCLISGLVFGWIRAKHPTFGNLPTSTAQHLRDFGLTVFIACIGLAAGPQAYHVILEQGVLLPFLAIAIVMISLVSSMLYARFVIKMPPVMITGALAGLLTCTPALNAACNEADSEIPVLGYTVPYAIANVLLTLLGPVIVLAVAV